MRIAECPGCTSTGKNPPIDWPVYELEETYGRQPTGVVLEVWQALAGRFLHCSPKEFTPNPMSTTRLVEELPLYFYEFYLCLFLCASIKLLTPARAY